MKERPILFSAPMVRALLAGTKTQTRRAVALPRSRDSFVLEDRGAGWWPYQSDDGESPLCDDGMEHPYTCPYGRPGDRLWVRESHWWFKDECDHETGYYPPPLTADDVEYRADGESKRHGWRPSIHMPRWASRIVLDVKAVRVERLQDISDDDLAAEGIQELIDGGVDHDGTPRDTYRALWEQLNGNGSWAANPWVWVVEFERAQAQQKGPAS